jgi:hypothetical protein
MQRFQFPLKHPASLPGGLPQTVSSLTYASEATAPNGGSRPNSMRPRVVMVMMVMVMPMMRRLRRSHPCQHHHRDRNSDNPNHEFRTPGKEICPLIE